MPLEVEAIYEDGALKSERRLPLRERQRVVITVQEEMPRPRISYDLIP
jgi:predicted DNA-binding antitoxin AbrB/MazE fold protein